MPRRLGDILIDDKLITPSQRDEALRQQKLHGGRIGTNLVELGAIDLDGLARALARQKGVPAALQKHFDSIHGEAVGLVPAKLAEKLGAIPLGFTARSPRTIAVAFLDPTRPGAIDEIQAASNSVVYPVIAPELRIVLYLEKLYWIPRPIRFLRLDLANAKAAGAPPSKAHSSEDPSAFFDMTRPDLSQRRPGSAILLTEAVPKSPPPASPPMASARAAERHSDLNVQRATSPAQPDSPRPSTAPAARQPVSIPPPRGVPVASRPVSGPTAPEIASRFGSSRATPTAFANPTGAQPPPASKPRPLATPPPWRKPPEVLQRRSDRTDASSRAPTIPDIPSFAIVDDEEPEPMQFRPEVVSGAFEPSPSTAPTIQIDSPLPPKAAHNGAASSSNGAPAAESGPLPWSTVQAVDAIAVATNRDQVGQAMVNYLRSACGVGLVLIVQHEVAMGWKGFAPGIGAADIEGLAIPLAAPSVLRIPHQQQDTFRGPPPPDGAAIDRQLWERLRSSPPQEIIVSPVIIRDRVVNLVYGHAEDGGPLPDRLMAGLGTLTRAASAAYVRLIQESKKKQPS